MSELPAWLTLPACIIAAPAAFATQYLTVEQAQAAIFPGEHLTDASLKLSDEQAKAIERRSGVSVRARVQRVWRASSGGFFIVDEVLGKHEFITYALGIEADGSVRGIEIMDYRETYGHEIRNAAWRRQFTGKSSSAAFKLDQDIQNISGATLSCRHIADGVKRLLALHDIVLK